MTVAFIEEVERDEREGERLAIGSCVVCGWDGGDIFGDVDLDEIVGRRPPGAGHF